MILKAERFFFFFNFRENWSCSILLSARESQRGQVRSVGGSISVLCHRVPFDANTGSLKVRNVPIRGKMLFILFFFFLCCELLQQQPPPLRSGDEATSLPWSLDRLRNTIRWQTICFIREREMKKYEGMQEISPKLFNESSNLKEQICFMRIFF